LIEGAYDATLYEEVLYQMFYRLRSEKAYEKKNIVLLMDNAKFHHHSKVLEICRLMKVNVLFNAEYSPWLNPIENFFGHVKKQVLRRVVTTK
jgi:transposase